MYICLADIAKKTYTSLYHAIERITSEGGAMKWRETQRKSMYWGGEGCKKCRQPSEYWALEYHHWYFFFLLEGEVLLLNA